MGVKEGWRGRLFEDFEVGDVYRHRLGRTISEADNTWFTLLTLNTNQIHWNAQYAERSEFGRVLVNSGFTIGLVLGMSVSDLSENAIANLEMDEIKLTHPVFVGDTLWAESKVTGKRESKSRPHAGPEPGRRRLPQLPAELHGLQAGSASAGGDLPGGEGAFLALPA